MHWTLNNGVPNWGAAKLITFGMGLVDPFWGSHNFGPYLFRCSSYPTGNHLLYLDPTTEKIDSGIFGGVYDTFFWQVIAFPRRGTMFIFCLPWCKTNKLKHNILAGSASLWNFPRQLTREALQSKLSKELLVQDWKFVEDTIDHQKFQVPKMEESWTLECCFGDRGWVFPYISRYPYSLYRFPYLHFRYLFQTCVP